MDAEAEARSLAAIGIASTSVNVGIVNGHKTFQFARSWKTSCPQTWEAYFRQEQNGLAVLTGRPSDLYVIDVDVNDDGMDAWAYLEGTRFEPVPPDTPRTRTGSGGMHLFFSLSQSVASGLLDPSCKTRIRYDGEAMGIDVRGEGGIVLVPPTRYEGREYVWLQRILPTRDNLRALPGWLVGLLNENARPARPVQNVDDEDDESEDEAPDRVVSDRIRACLIVNGDSSSYLDRVKTDAEGRLYVFRVTGPRTCPYGNRHSGSNNFAVLVRGQTLLYRCNSPECDGLPLKEIGCLTFAESIAGGNNERVDLYDKSVYSTLTYRFMERSMASTDLGGAQVFSRMYQQCGRVVFGSRGYYVWDGKRYVLDPKGDRVRLLCAHQLNGAYMRFRHLLERAIADEEDPAVQKSLRERLKSVPNWTKASSTKSCMEFMRGTMLRTDFEEQLSANPDIMNCNNGVVDLRTGRLHPHSTHFMCDTVLDTDYMGIDHPTPAVDAFFEDVFNGNADVITYMQALLGYSVTGHTSMELMVIWHGTGANGKGILASMLAALLQDYYIAMQKSCVVKSEGQRSAASGGPSPHLAELKGRRVGLVDESAKDEKLDAATVKLCTGGGLINARFLYGQNFTFKPTHQTFLLTNHRPEIDVDDQAVRRRLVLVPFVNQYKSAEQYDPTNPLHRLRDDTLKARLVQPEVLRQFLSWLVRGSVRWYAQGLPETPPLLSASLNDYYAENDPLGEFIADQCVVEEGKRVSTTAFKARFEGVYGCRIGIRDLVGQMKHRGFTKKTARIDRQALQCFIGVALLDEEAG